MEKVLFVATVVKTHIMTFHLPYLKMFKAMGYTVDVAARNDYEQPEECVIPYCDHFYDIPFEREPLRPENVRAFLALKKIIENGGYRIIHCHTPVGAMLTRLAAVGARKSGTKILYTAHGFHFYQGAPLKNWLLYYPVERLLAHLTDVLITINQEDYERAKKFKAGKVYYVPGVGIDLNKFNTAAVDTAGIRSEFGLKKQDFLLLSVGEINCNKNHRVVIEALGKIKNAGIYYIICGTGPLTAEYKNLAKQLGIEKQIIFAGYRKDILEFYKTADVFLFPSHREGLSVALMEAMACGLPVICSNIRGNTDLIENGVSGMLAGNDPDSVADAILTMYRDENLRKRYAKAAREKIEQYSIERVSEMMRKIYQSALRET